MEHIIYCSDQIDGICSAAIVARALRLSGRDWHLGGALRRSASHSAPQKTASFYILDIPPSQLSLVKSLVGSNKISFWCSDEPAQDNVLSQILSMCQSVSISGSSSSICSAQLCAERFLPNDATANLLASLAHDIKHWRNSDERAKKLADIIASGFDVKKLVDMLSKGVLWSDSLDKVRSDFIEKKTKSLSELSKHLVVKEYLGKKFAFVLANNILPSPDAGESVLTSSPDCVIAVIVYRDGRIIFRRRDLCSIDLIPIARLFNGGGRHYAAGGVIEHNVSSDNWESTLFSIDRKLKDFFLK